MPGVMSSASLDALKGSWSEEVNYYSGPMPWLGAGAPAAFVAYVTAFLVHYLALALGAKFDLSAHALGGADQRHSQ